MFSKFFICIICLMLGAQAWGYTPPSSPELYEPQLTEAQIKTLPKGLFFGGSGGFGMSFGESDKSRMAFEGELEFGFQRRLGSWKTWDISVLGVMGEIGSSNLKVGINYGLGAKTGFGYLIGNGLVGNFGLGVKIFNAEFSGKDKTVPIKSSESSWGTGFFANYHLATAVTKSLWMLGGVNWTYYSVNFDKFQLNNQEQTESKHLSFHSPKLFVGFRFYLQ